MLMDTIDPAASNNRVSGDKVRMGILRKSNQHHAAKCRSKASRLA
jgi:hypothetical protein